MLLLLLQTADRDLDLAMSQCTRQNMVLNSLYLTAPENLFDLV